MKLMNTSLACRLVLGVVFAAQPFLGCAIKAQGNDPDTQPYTVDCKRPKDHDAADLCEQRRQAQAAEDAVWWSRAQSLVGGVGILGIIGTLFYAHATLRQNTSTARRQLRAYVAVDPIRFERREPEQAKITVTNGGQTPALNVSARLNWAWVPTGQSLAEDYSFPDHPQQPGPSSVSVIHKDRTETFTFNIDPGSLARVRAGEISLFFYGHVDYQDVFDEPHTTRFFYQYFPAFVEGTHMGHSLLKQPNRNDAT